MTWKGRPSRSFPGDSAGQRRLQGGCEAACQAKPGRESQGDPAAVDRSAGRAAGPRHNPPFHHSHTQEHDNSVGPFQNDPPLPPWRRNAFNVYRGYVHLFGSAAPLQLAKHIGELEAAHAWELARLPAAQRGAFLTRKEAAAEGPGALRWVMPPPILDEAAYRGA